MYKGGSHLDEEDPAEGWGIQYRETALVIEKTVQGT